MSNRTNSTPGDGNTWFFGLLAATGAIVLGMFIAIMVAMYLPFANKRICAKKSAPIPTQLPAPAPAPAPAAGSATTAPK